MLLHVQPSLRRACYTVLSVIIISYSTSSLPVALPYNLTLYAARSGARISSAQDHESEARVRQGKAEI